MGLKDRVSKDVCPWYDGPSLLEYLDNMKALERKVNAPFMMPISGKYKVRLVSLPCFVRILIQITGHGYYS
jgi:translation elongation factor EF-1alpha